MDEKIQWRKRVLIRIVIFADIAFGVTTIGFYLYILIGLNEYLDLPVDVDISAYGNYSWVIETLNSGFLVLLNCVQVIFSSILFANLIQTHLDFLQSLQKSYNWLQVTKILYILLCVKIIFILLYSFIPPKNETTFSIFLLKSIASASESNSTDKRLVLRFVFKILSVVEWAFKPVAIYIVEIFVQDLVNHRYSQMCFSLSSTSTSTTPVRQRKDLNSQSVGVRLNLQDELKSNLFWINYKNEDITEASNFTSCGNPRTSQMATGSCSHSHSHSQQMKTKSLSKHFCVISSPAVTVDGNGPSPSTSPTTSSSLPTSHHI